MIVAPLVASITSLFIPKSYLAAIRSGPAAIVVMVIFSVYYWCVFMASDPLVVDPFLLAIVSLIYATGALCLIRFTVAWRDPMAGKTEVSFFAIAATAILLKLFSGW